MSLSIVPNATDENLSGILNVLKNVKAHWERTSGGSKIIRKTEAAIEKARNGEYAICPCEHIATAEEIHRSPFHCSGCGLAFV